MISASGWLFKKKPKVFKSLPNGSHHRYDSRKHIRTLYPPQTLELEVFHPEVFVK